MFHFFYGGPLSQWHPCNFVYAGLQFNCAEQAMMATKAVLFSDFATCRKIMESQDPHEQKSLGRQVKNFDVAKWNAEAREFVYWINVAKFGHSAYLRGELHKTKPAILVEASPTDRLWGIGLDEHDPRAQDKSQWRGANWLGEVLMAVRDGKPPKWSDTIHVYDSPPPI